MQDIVIEDAAYTLMNQEDLLAEAFALVKPGGYYIIEDLGLDKTRAWREDPSALRALSRKVLEENDSFYIDLAVGHRAFNQWQDATRKWTRSRTEHNSNLLVIHKRLQPLGDPRINFGRRAMSMSHVVTRRTVSKLLRLADFDIRACDKSKLDREDHHQQQTPCRAQTN